MKRCSRCGEEKPVEDFHFNRKARDQRHAYCKACGREKALAWRQANLERARANARSWARNNVERKREWEREYYAKDPEKFLERQRAYNAKAREKDFEGYTRKRRAATWMRKYGITPEQYDALMVKQGGVCALCSAPPHENARLKWLCVDHDHATGAVRGLLCQRCNRTLGLYEDDAEWFARAARYLRKKR